MFPHECPYPQLEDEQSSRLLISEWQEDRKRSPLLSEEERQQLVALAKAEEEEFEDSGEGQKKQMLDEKSRRDKKVALVSSSLEKRVVEMSQWSMQEKLYVDHHHLPVQQPQSRAMTGLAALVKVGIILSSVFAVRSLAERTKGFVGDSPAKPEEFRI